MIGKLKGIIDAVDAEYALLDVHGVGYIVYASARTLRNLPAQGEAVSLLIETHVREDHIHLYGFVTTQEQEAFRKLLKVNGVGAKMALAILGTLSVAQMGNAIALQDKGAFQQVSGVGPKLAARLVTELKDAFGNIAIETTAIASNNNAVEAIASGASNVADAVSALVNLGYSRDRAYDAVTKAISQDNNLPVGELIRQGLKELSVA